MKFSDKYPHASDALKLNPDRLLGPYPIVAIGKGILQTWAYYPCSYCDVRTSWVLVCDGLWVHICSEECMMKYAALSWEELGNEEWTGSKEVIVNVPNQTGDNNDAGV